MVELSTIQLRVLREVVAPNASCFILVDLREGVRVTEVFERVWAPGNIVKKDNQGGLAQLLGNLRATPREMVVLTRHNAAPLAENIDPDVLRDLAELWFEFSEKLDISLSDDGQMYRRGEAINPDDFALPTSAFGVKITVQGAGAPVVQHNTKLPFRLGIRIMDSSPSSWIEVSGEEVVPPLPNPQRFHMSGLTSGCVEIGIDPRRDRDNWQVRCIDRDQNTHPVGLIRARQPVPASPPDRLAVIFDRTCPDEGQWARARGISLGESSHDAASFLQDEPVADDAPCSQADVNEGIREAIGPALVEALAGNEVDIDGWWFADTPGDGVNQPPGADSPAVNFGMSGSEPVRSAARLFDNLSWYPGLDLWDPLDHALDAASRDLAAARGHRKSILIIGNSPPYLPSEIDSPFQEVRVSLGHPTAVRRSSHYWKDALEKCRNQNIDVAYLFLTHDRTPPGLARAFDLFRNIQNEVRSALELSGIHIVSRPATTEGIAAGVQAAWQALCSPQDLSNVRMSHDL